MTRSIAVPTPQRAQSGPARDLLGHEPVGELRGALAAGVMAEREIDGQRALEPVVVRQRLGHGRQWRLHHLRRR